jgi:hypothetical protein
LSGIGVIFSSPAEAQPFPTFPTHPFTVGNTYMVNTTEDLGGSTGVGDCLHPVTGESCSFREAVNQYNLDTSVAPSPFLYVINQDQITFAPAQCAPTNNCPDPQYDIATGNVVFDNPNGVSVTVTGNGQGVTQIYGGGSADLQIDGGYGVGAVTFSDLAISSGYSPDCGGGILNDGGTVTVNGSTLINNTAVSDGGGICNLNGTVNLNEATVIGNNTPEQGVDGGGIYNSGGLLQISESIIVENGAGTAGGGIYNAAVGGTSAWLFSTAVDYNGAGIDGGGIYNGNFLEVLPASTVEYNTAGTYGGGVYNACNAFYPGGGVGVINNHPDNVYQQPCSSFPGLPPGFVFPGFPTGLPPGIGLIDPVP